MMTSGAPALPDNYTVQDLEGINPDSAYYDTQVSYTNIRQQAIQEAAQSLGMQAGLNQESIEIDAILTAQSEQLDRLFDFNQVMYQDNVLPPVLNKANNLVNINSQGDTIRIAGETYNILAPARFVTAPPTWRDYIWMSYPKPTLPDRSLLPQNSKEQAFWEANVALGWQQGINQAISIFTINLNTLSRDFSGMLLYKELLIQNMVSPYYVKTTEQGVTGSANHMMVDDQTLQITSQPQLLYQTQRWQAKPTQLTSPPVPVAVPETASMAPEEGDAVITTIRASLPIPSVPVAEPAVVQPVAEPTSLTGALERSVQEPDHGGGNGPAAVSQ
jgi:defect-in-organelle-trafficking protein DotC